MDAGQVITPPYVAGPLTLSPFSALMLAPHRVGDPSTGRAFARPYRGVAARLDRWQAKGLLRRDDRAALYLHEYSAAGLTVRGLVGALNVSRRATRPEDRAVLPHEGIHPAQADDLADRMRQMGVNPAPILLVHRATARLRSILAEVVAGHPERQFTDRSEQHHRIWTIRDPESLAVIASELRDARALIADGHHRYAAYLRLQRRSPGGPFDSGLAMLVDQIATPLFVGAIHRSLTGTSLADVRSAAESIGLPAVPRTQVEAVSALGPSSLAVTDGDQWVEVQLSVPENRAAVEILHHQLIPALPHGPSATSYHHSVDDALAVAAPDSVAVLMPAPSVGLVQRIALADRLLPQKATSFQPKPSLGVIVRSLDDA